jgi:cytidine deaminase
MPDDLPPFPNAASPVAEALAGFAARLARRAYVPFSRAPVGAVALVADGRLVPGVRVESASFSLTLPALRAAHAAAVACGVASEVVAFALSRAARADEVAFLAELPEAPFRRVASGVYARADASGADLPRPVAVLDPTEPPASTPAEGVARARALAEARAYVPASAYPVGALVEVQGVQGHDAGALVPGVNVEHADWTRTLCAERTALALALALGALHPPLRHAADEGNEEDEAEGGAARALYLACARDPEGTPCGACRQWLTELAPEAVLWMHRLGPDPASARPADLLPGSFRGNAIPRATA